MYLKYSYVKKGVSISKDPIIIQISKNTVEKLKANTGKSGLLNSEGIRTLQEQKGFIRQDRDLLQYLSERIMHQVQAMQEVIEYLKVILKISNNDQGQWENENWIQVCQKNPILWAMENHRKIDNQDPVKWASDNILQFIIDPSKINIVIIRLIIAEENGSFLVLMLDKVGDQNNKQELIKCIKKYLEEYLQYSKECLEKCSDEYLVKYYNTEITRVEIVLQECSNYCGQTMTCQ